MNNSLIKNMLLIILNPSHYLNFVSKFFYLILCSVIIFSCSSGEAGGGASPSDFTISEIGLTIAGTSVSGIVQGTTVVFKFPFPSSLIPSSATMEYINFSASGVTSSKKVGNLISFTNKLSTITATSGSTSKTFDLKLVNSANLILEFAFKKSVNPGLPNDIYATVGNGKITFSSAIPNTVNRTALKPTFTLSAGATAKIGNSTQLSEQNPNDYGIQQLYDITAEDGTSLYSYTVDPIPILVVVPDANLRSTLKSRYRNIFVGDYIDPKSSDIPLVKTLDVSALGISDLTGLEYFTELTDLNCSSNNLSSINISKFLKLKTLNASNNSLTSIDFTNNTELTDITLSSNNLLNLATIVRLPKLVKLAINANPSLASINLSSNSLLQNLNISNCNFSSLGLGVNLNLTSLNCSSNKLTSLDLSKNTKLTSLICTSNSLTYLNISGMASVTTLSILNTAGTTENNFKDNASGELVINTYLNSNAEVSTIRNNKPLVKITVQ